jgi:hypothetical protein
MDIKQINMKFYNFMENADADMQKEYERYKEYVLKEAGSDDKMYLVSYPSFCFGLFVDLLDEIEFEKQLNDLIE